MFFHKSLILHLIFSEVIVISTYILIKTYTIKKYILKLEVYKY